jgi:hypothetical protein
MAIPSQAEYERREAAEAHGRLQEIERAPLTDRKEAQAAFLDVMASDPALVGERIGWLLAGNYGWGQMQMAKRVVAAGGRTNKRAQLTHLIGAFEWMCPPVMAAAAWKKLTKKQQADLDAVLDMVIAEASKDEE